MKIENYKQINRGAIFAKFDLYFDKMGMSIRECLLFKSGAKHWVGMPSRAYEDQEGQKKFFQFVTFSDEKRDSFQKKCLELLQPFEDIHPTPTESEEIPF